MTFHSTKHLHRDERHQYQGKTGRVSRCVSLQQRSKIYSLTPFLITEYLFVRIVGFDFMESVCKICKRSFRSLLGIEAGKRN